jgi:hypothetical protein
MDDDPESACRGAIGSAFHEVLDEGRIESTLAEGGRISVVEDALDRREPKLEDCLAVLCSNPRAHPGPLAGSLHFRSFEGGRPRISDRLSF